MTQTATNPQTAQWQTRAPKRRRNLPKTTPPHAGTNPDGPHQAKTAEGQDPAGSNQTNQARISLDNWLQSLRPREAEIVRHRLGSPENRQTLQRIADRIGISRERVAQIQRMIQHNFNNAVSRTDRNISQAITRTAVYTGVAMPEDQMTELLASMEIDDYTLLILDKAGPYDLEQGWFVRRDTKLLDPTSRLIKNAAPHGVISPNTLNDAYAKWGLPHHLNLLWLVRQCPIRIVNGQILLIGSSLSVRIKQALHILQRPATAQEIVTAIGEKCGLNTAMNQLSIDKTFVRTDRNHWALAEWNLPVYHNCVTAIKEIIEERGPMEVKEIVERISAYNLKPNTIRANLKSSMFKINRGVVTLAPVKETAPSKPLGTYRLPRGLFINGPKTLTKLVNIDQGTLRGTSTPMGNSAAKIVGLPRGGSQIYQTESQATIQLNHPDENNAVITISTIRAILKEMKAKDGDLAAVTLDGNTMAAKVNLIKAKELTPSWESLSRLTGVYPVHHGQSASDALAPALLCEPDQVIATLKGRKDFYVLNAMPKG